MQGIVSLLDDETYARVERLWDELKRDFGVRGLYTTTFPHCSYQVAESYDVEAAERFLQRLAARTRPFRVTTAGLGVFTSSNPVLYVPVVRSPRLAALHQEVWDGAVPRLPGEVTRYYQPELWMPHITLAHGDLSCDVLAEIVRSLGTRGFHWELEVNNLSMIYDTSGEQGLRFRFNFGGGGTGDAC